MTFLQFHQAISGRIAEWLASYEPNLPVDWDNAPASPQLKAAWEGKGAAWIRPVVAVADTATASIGHKPNSRTEGLVQIQVFVPENATIRRALEIGDSLGQHLEHWRSGSLATDCYSVNRSGTSDGWFMAVVSVPFTAG